MAGEKVLKQESYSCSVDLGAAGRNLYFCPGLNYAVLPGSPSGSGSRTEESCFSQLSVSSHYTAFCGVGT